MTQPTRRGRETQAAIDAAVKAAVEPLQAAIDEQAETIAALQAQKPADALAEADAQAAQEKAALEAKAAKARTAKG